MNNYYEGANYIIMLLEKVNDTDDRELYYQLKGAVDMATILTGEEHRLVKKNKQYEVIVSAKEDN
mgnify:CR=1 FL=1